MVQATFSEYGGVKVEPITWEDFGHGQRVSFFCTPLDDATNCQAQALSRISYSLWAHPAIGKLVMYEWNYIITWMFYWDHKNLSLVWLLSRNNSGVYKYRFLTLSGLATQHEWAGKPDRGSHNLPSECRLNLNLLSPKMSFLSFHLKSCKGNLMSRRMEKFSGWLIILRASWSILLPNPMVFSFPDVSFSEYIRL